VTKQANARNVAITTFPSVLQQTISESERREALLHGGRGGRSVAVREAPSNGEPPSFKLPLLWL
jgi:hypothetical protein